MDFKLSKTHLLQQEMYRKFAETEIKPIAEEMDETEVYDLELLAKMHKYGLMGIPYSRGVRRRRWRLPQLCTLHGRSIQDRRKYWYHDFRTHFPVLLLHRLIRY